MDRRLGEPLPHQQANPPRARPWSEAEATFSNRSAELLGHSVLIRVSPGYPGTKGGLPTCYSPVRRFPQAEAWFSLDLHVLSAPPAFVLSQDQTLREEWLPTIGVETTPGRRSFHFELCYCSKADSTRATEPAPKDRPGDASFLDEVETLSLRAGQSLLRDRGSRHRRTFAVEFSKTGAVSV